MAALERNRWDSSSPACGTSSLPKIPDQMARALLGLEGPHWSYLSEESWLWPWGGSGPSTVVVALSREGLGLCWDCGPCCSRHPGEGRQGPQQPLDAPGLWEGKGAVPGWGGGGSPSTALAVPGSGSPRLSFEM